MRYASRRLFIMRSTVIVQFGSQSITQT